jgi:hypothetical protein
MYLRVSIGWSSKTRERCGRRGSKGGVVGNLGNQGDERRDGALELPGSSRESQQAGAPRPLPVAPSHQPPATDCGQEIHVTKLGLPYKTTGCLISISRVSKEIQATEY